MWEALESIFSSRGRESGFAGPQAQRLLEGGSAIHEVTSVAAISLTWKIVRNLGLAACFCRRNNVSLDQIGQVLVQGLHAHAVAGLD